VKFNCAAIKQNTEDVILVRSLHSNDTDQQNQLTQFIDINPRPSFDYIDHAVFDRTAVININHSYFVNEKKRQLQTYRL
jgi:hypothetical protein